MYDSRRRHFRVSRDLVLDEFGQVMRDMGSDRKDARAVWSPDCQLPYMHYTDRFWDTDRTLWGREEPGLSYDYNDRLQSWDSAMFRVGQAYAKLRNPQFSANWWASHLTAYYMRTVVVRHVVGGCNRATGYEYYAIGYKLGDLLPAEELVVIRRIAGKLLDRGDRLPKRIREAVAAASSDISGPPAQPTPAPF